MSDNRIKEKDTFTIAVIGTLSAGKTSIVNALLEEEILHSYALPTSSIINVVKYGEKKEAILYFKDSLPQELPVSISNYAKEYMKEHDMGNVPPLKIGYDEIEDYVVKPMIDVSNGRSLESPYEKVEILLPLPILKEGIVIMDMPGLSDLNSRYQVSKDYLSMADLILFILSADHLCSTQEMDFIQFAQANYGSCKTIFVVNRLDLIHKDDIKRIKEFADMKLSAFTNNPIFFVSAEMASRGINNENADLYEKSGISQLSNYLKHYVILDRDMPSKQTSYMEDSKTILDYNGNMSHKEYHINNSTIKIIFGNILDSQAEVIVSSDDCNITMGGGVSMAIRHKEGTNAILLDVKKKVPADIGDVVVSTAGTLPQKNIFHVITIDFNGRNLKGISGLISKEDVHQYIIGHSIDKCFQLLHAMDIKSIAFPQIGAGVAGIPFDMVAHSMAEAIGRNLRKTNKSFNVELYLYDRFGQMRHWDYLPMFEQFSAQEAISRMLFEQAYGQLTIDEEKNQRPTETMQDIDKDIFISYSRKDLEIVKQIYEWLEKSGFQCWLDVDGMFSGVSYKKVIVNAIKRSKVLLFMSSENSNKSRNVVSEVSIAVEYGKKIIPVRLDMTPYSESIEYDIINHDYVVFEKSQKEDSNREILKKIVSTLEMM